MDPITLAVMSIGSTVASGVLGAAGSIMSGEANANAAMYQAEVAKQNAAQATQAGLIDSERQNWRTRAMLGSQEAEIAGHGIDVGSGSALNIRRSTAELGALDAATIRYNAEMKAYGQRADAQLYMAKAQSARTAGYLGAGTSLINTVSGVSDKWLGYKSKGVFGYGSGTGVISPVDHGMAEWYP